MPSVKPFKIIFHLSISKIRIGFITAIVSLVVSSLLSYLITLNLIYNARRMTHSVEVQKSLQTINNEVMKAESSIWDYRLSGDTSFLHPSLQERNNIINSQYGHLRRITTGSPVQQANLDTLYGYLQKKYALLQLSVTWNFNEHGKYPLIKGALYNDSLNRKIVGMNLVENHLLVTHSHRFHFLSNNFVIPILILSLISVFITIFSYYLLSRDITYLNRAKDQLELYQKELQSNIDLLRQSNDELEQFAYVASHDLQEPLRKVLTFGDRLQVRYEDKLDEEGRELIERMKFACERMRTLINDLLSFSRISRNYNAHVRKVDLGSVLNDVYSELEEIIEAKEAVIQMDGHFPVIDAIDTELYQLFQNILSNALKYSSPGRKSYITIACEIIKGRDAGIENEPDEKEPYCRITIRDNGIGFDNKYAEKIFMIFQRLHGRHEYDGTGIGLAICKKIVENHHGIIYATGTPGAGSVFTIILPLHS